MVMPDRCSHDVDPLQCDACYADDVASALAPVVPLDQVLAELEATNRREVGRA